MWVLAGDDLVTRPRSDIQTAKFMFTVMWNSLGFHVIDKVPTSAKMNSEYFTTNIFARLAEKIFPERRTAHAKRLIVHMDNCSIHRSGGTEDYRKQNNMMRFRHPPYSPKLAPSDFGLFPGVKEKLKRIRKVDEQFIRLTAGTFE
jgi:histone-lysine N-methyltransferase SETMAR